MEWNEKLQKIIDYVENHLQRIEEPINIEEITKIANCSFGFFQKVFSYMNNISFSEYVRFRKMTLAGYDLKSTKMKVVDISYKYGYDSPTSFTKAFQQFHGISPTKAREDKVELNVFPKMQLTSNQKYAWRLEKKEAFQLIGKSIIISSTITSSQEQVTAFWNQCFTDGTFAQLACMDEGFPKGIFGLWEQSQNQTRYSIATISQQKVTEDFQTFEIPTNTWATFDCKGPVPSAIQQGWQYLNEEWILKYPFQHAKCPEMEWYSSGNSYSEDYFSQIWIPILEK